MKNTFKIEIALDVSGAMYSETETDENGEYVFQPQYEIARILREIADNIEENEKLVESCSNEDLIYCYYGNRIGKISLSNDEIDLYNKVD